ncbi:MAG: hypothetical protein BWY54_00587 [Candidatus Dependentiae bacterium ADurb.Bin331]|nr:MAG: hypothetical protein BWY54_00587 [Candidatus Dependentiae bacterium ADurb.Bin331]
MPIASKGDSAAKIAYHTALCSSTDLIFAMVNVFSVNVPVLSVHTSCTLPKLSIAESLFTITFFLASRETPCARQKVTTTGNASGITVIANAVEKMNKLNKLILPAFRKTFAANTHTNVMITSKIITLPS